MHRKGKLLMTWLCILMCAVPVFAFAEERIQTTYKASNGTEVVVDMPVPEAIITDATMYKLETIHISKEDLLAVMEKYGMPLQQGERWEVSHSYAGSAIECECVLSDKSVPTELIFADYGGLPSAVESEAQQKADETARAVLSQLGIENDEYPFYYCDFLYKGAGYVFQNETDYLKSGISSVVEEEWQRTGGPALLVVVRLKLNEIPFGTSISWTEHSNSAGDGNPTPGIVIGVTQEGFLTGMIIRNLFTVTKTKTSMEPLLGWEEVLNANLDVIAELHCTGEQTGTSLTLLRAQMVYLTDSNNIAFPAWELIFEEEVPDSYLKAHGMDSLLKKSIISLYFRATDGKGVN